MSKEEYIERSAYEWMSMGMSYGAACAEAQKEWEESHSKE